MIAKSELIINQDGTAFHIHMRPDQLADIVLLVGDPAKITALGGKPMITIEDCLTDLFNEMVVRRRTELMNGMGKDLRL